MGAIKERLDQAAEGKVAPFHSVHYRSLLDVSDVKQ
jgi:hypothetical protein